MNRPWIRPLLAGAALWVAATGLHARPLPFTIDTQDGQWKPATVQQVVAPGINFEAVVTHVGATDRMIVLSSAGAGGSPEALGLFAHRLIDSFTSYRSANLREEATTEMDYSGRKLQFDLTSEKGTLDCELFVFAEGLTQWGVLYSRPNNGPVPLVSAFRLLSKVAALPSGVVAMEPFRVKDIPISGFPLSFEAIHGVGSDRVRRIIVTEVPERSATDRAGVKVGDAIISIDGRKAQDFTVGVGKGSELGRIFLNRDPGDEVKLEILPAGSDKPISLTLHAVSTENRPWLSLPTP